MKTDWTKKVNEINRQRYTVPDGWETKEQVAASLQCDPDRVADLLKPGLQSGDIERTEWPVWDEKRRLTVRCVCYRLCDKDCKQERVQANGRARAPRGGTVEQRIIQALERNPGASNRQIAKNLFGVRSSDVEAVRATL